MNILNCHLNSLISERSVIAKDEVPTGNQHEGEAKVDIKRPFPFRVFGNQYGKDT